MPRYALILAIMGFRLAVKKLKMAQIIKYDGMMLEITSIALAFHRKHPTTVNADSSWREENRSIQLIKSKLRNVVFAKWTAI